jgi:hypothetical protein
VRTRSFLALPLVACQAQGAGEMRGLEVVARDGRDQVALTLRRTSNGCIADENLSIFAHSEGITAGAWRLARGATGRELTGPQGLIARIVDEPGPPRRLSIVDPVGVPMARVNFDESITITDGSRSFLGTIEPAERGFTFSGGGRVTGTTDAELAARLLVPLSIPDEARALFACGRLAVTTPAAK